MLFVLYYMKGQDYTAFLKQTAISLVLYVMIGIGY